METQISFGENSYVEPIHFSYSKSLIEHILNKNLILNIFNLFHVNIPLLKWFTKYSDFKI